MLSKKVLEKIADIPLPPDPNGNVVLRRINGTPATNVPHRWILHSPTGYEWGYPGSGPADLALNILLMFVEKDVADLLHQPFKFDFLINMPEEGGVIKRQEIEQWLVRHTEVKKEKM